MITFFPEIPTKNSVHNFFSNSVKFFFFFQTSDIVKIANIQIDGKRNEINPRFNDNLSSFRFKEQYPEVSNITLETH